MKILANEIAKILEKYLSTNYGEVYNYEAFISESSESYAMNIHVYAFNKKIQTDKICLIQIGINENNEQIYIPNIIVPLDFKHKGVGKKMIYIVFKIGKKYNYEVFVVQLTDGFRERLLKRGAVTTDIYDILCITETTDLL